MEKRQIKTGDRVTLVLDGKTVEGTIFKTYEFSDVAIVKYDSALIKIPFNELTVLPPKEEAKENDVPRMRSLPEVAAYFKELDPNTQITERTLRQMIDEGTIPAQNVGKKLLLNLDLVIAILGIC